MTTIIDGKKYANEIKESLLEQLTKTTESLSFHIIYVGSDPVIDNFIRYKKKFGDDLGISVVVHQFSKTVSEQDLRDAVESIIPFSTGMIIQLPLPKHLDTQTILDLVPSAQDVDVLSQNTRTLFGHSETDLVPPVTAAIIHILEKNNIELTNKNIVLLGNGNLVGYPTSLWLDREGYRYSVINEETPREERDQALAQADIIISGVGIPELIIPSMIQDGVVCVDAGTSESGKKIHGDFHPDCAKKASLFTPVPGGIGPLTIAMLYHNIIHAYFHSHHDKYSRS